MSYETADRIAGTGVALFCLGIAVAFATFMTWAEIGVWNEVITGGSAIAVGLFGAGLGLAWLGDREAERWREKDRALARRILEDDRWPPR